jgi:hypothetical protein
MQEWWQGSGGECRQILTQATEHGYGSGRRGMGMGMSMGVCSHGLHTSAPLSAHRGGSSALDPYIRGALTQTPFTARYTPGATQTPAARGASQRTRATAS